MSEDRKLELVIEAIYKNRMYDVIDLKNALFEEKMWNIMIKSEENLRNLMIKHGFCPYCLSELIFKIDKIYHGDCSESDLIEYYQTFYCPKNHDLR